MFCGKCGAKNPDDAVVCGQCGAPLTTAAAPMEAAAASPARGTNASRSGVNHRFIGIGAVAVAAVVVVILLVSIFGGRGYKTTVDKYFNSTLKADAKGLMSVFPDKVLDELLDNYDSRKEAIEQYNKTLAYVIEREYGDSKIKYSITYIDTEDISGDELRGLKNDYVEDYDLKIKAAMEVDIKATITVDGKEESQTMTIPLIKVGSSWYIDVEHFGSIF